MPIELVWLGGVLVVAAGGLIFLFIQRRKPAELAYDLWHARDCPDGLPEDDWIQTKRQLLGRAKTTRPKLARPKRGPQGVQNRIVMQQPASRNGMDAPTQNNLRPASRFPGSQGRSLCREDRDGAAAHLMLHGILVDGMIERIDGRPQYADVEIRKRREAGHSSAYLFAARNEQEFQRKKQAESGG